MSDLGGGTNGTTNGATTTTTTTTTTSNLTYLGTQVVDLRPLILGTIWSLTALSLLFLGARCWVKQRTAHRGLLLLHADDYVLLAAASMLIAFAGTTTWGTQSHELGVSHNKEDDSTLLVVVVAMTCSVLGAAWSKTAFAITLLRVTSKGLLNKFIWFIIGSMNLALVFNAIMQFVRCQPVEAMWTKGTGGTCWISRNAFIYYCVAAAGYSAAMDIILAIIPWLVLRKLEMQSKEKVGVAVCMSLGLIAAMASIFRAYYIPTIYDDKNNAYDQANLFIWTAAELAVTIIAVSIPVLRPLVVNMKGQRDRNWGPEGGTRYQNTFQNGTYVCSAVSRSQNNYHRMNSSGSGSNFLKTITTTGSSNSSSGTTTTSSKQSGKAGTTVEVVMHEGNRELELIAAPGGSACHKKEKSFQGIVKTEEVTVDYDRASRMALQDNFERRAILGFELEEMGAPGAGRGADRSKRPR